jgi:hypothetical protein
VFEIIIYKVVAKTKDFLRVMIIKKTYYTIILFLVFSGSFLFKEYAWGANYFIDNTATCTDVGNPATDCDGSLAKPWNSLTHSDMKVDEGIRSPDSVVYVRGNTGIPYNPQEWGFGNCDDSDDGCYSATFYGNWTGVGTTLGADRAEISGRKIITGYALVSGTKYQKTDTTLNVGLGSGADYYGGDIPVGSGGVWVNNIALVSAANVGAVVPGKYFFNASTNLLTFDAGVAPTTVYATYAIEAIEFNWDMQIRNFIVEYARRGGGNGWCSDFTIQGNRFRYNLLAGLEPGGANAIISGNEIDHNGGYGLSLVSFGFDRNHIFTNNYVHDNGLGGMLLESNYTLYNNTIVNNGGTGLSIVKPATGLSSLTARNNIIAGNTSGQVNAQDDPAVSITADYNNVYGTSSYSGKWTQGAHDVTSDPLFISSSNFHLQNLSPAIDKGIDVFLTSDYDGNHIYGTPDIGAYEYQPPYTNGTDLIDITSPLRIYADGKYRYTAATSGTQTANFSVAPEGGYSGSNHQEYINATLNSWLTTGTRNKQWTAGSNIATNTIYTIGDLVPSKYYQFKLDGLASTSTITGATCTNGLCLSSPSGFLTFTYAGGYSTHIFALEQNIEAPTNVGILSISADSTSQLTVTAKIAVDANPGLHATPYWFNQVTDSPGGSSSIDWQTPTTFVDSGLSTNTQYSYRVKAKDGNSNESVYSEILSKYTLAPNPTNLSGTTSQTAINLSVDSFTNATLGLSGYYFSRLGNNSTWIQNNSWNDAGLTCGTSYVYSVKYRNGDGVETDPITLIKSTDACPGGSIPLQWYNPPLIPTGGFSVSINNGAEKTTTPLVVLNLVGGSDTTRMAISNYSDFRDSGQEDYVSTKAWNLCLNEMTRKSLICQNGTYTVYVKYYTSWGTTSSVASDTIIYQTSLNSVSSNQPFTKDLRLGQVLIDVKRLQVFLNQNSDTQVAKSGVGSPGKETNFFGSLTRLAVIKFQEKYASEILTPLNFTKGTGVVSKKTRAKINELLGF